MASGIRADIPAVASHRFDDAVAQARLRAGWHQSYWQLSDGRYAGSVDAVALDGTQVFIESANRALLQRGTVPGTSLALALPVRLAGEARFCGTAFTGSQVCVFSGEGGFEFHAPADHQVAAVEFTPDLVATDIRLRRIRDRIGHAAHARAADTLALRALHELIRGIVAALSTTPALAASAHARSALRESLIASVVELLDDTGRAVPAMTMQARWALVARARELIEASAFEPISVAAVCDRLGVSRRTLQYCFQDVLGIGPKAYLRAMRLNAVRLALFEGARSVTDVALDHGFWHLGQFAVDYRRMFGESPSRTLARARHGPSASGSRQQS